MNLDEARILRVARRVTQSLSARQFRSGSLWDPVDRRAAPPNHYAETWFAVACELSDGNAELHQDGHKALNRYLSLPKRKRGHNPFNRLSLVLLLAACKTTGCAVFHDRPGMASLLDSLGQSPSDTTNWNGLLAASFAIEYKLLGVTASYEKALGVLRQRVLPLQSEHGIYVDFRSGDGSISPLCYHATSAAMVALTGWLLQQETIILSALRGYDAVRTLLTRTAEPLPYGRSANSLFGLVNSYVWLSVLARALENLGDVALQVTRARSLVVSAIESMLEGDGFLRPFQGVDGGVPAVWDTYVHASVYNAYAAGLLTALPLVMHAAHSEIPKSSYSRCPEAEDLVRSVGTQGRATLTINGQVAPGREYFTVDPRYAGLNILRYCVEGTEILPGPSLYPTSRRKRIDRLIERASLPFGSLAPVISVGNTRLSPRKFRIIDDRIGEDGTTSIVGDGTMVEIRKSPFLKRLMSLATRNEYTPYYACERHGTMLHRQLVVDNLGLGLRISDRLESEEVSPLRYMVEPRIVGRLESLDTGGFSVSCGPFRLQWRIYPKSAELHLHESPLGGFFPHLATIQIEARRSGRATTMEIIHDIHAHR